MKYSDCIKKFQDLIQRWLLRIGKICNFLLKILLSLARKRWVGKPTLPIFALRTNNPALRKNPQDTPEMLHAKFVSFLHPHLCLHNLLCKRLVSRLWLCYLFAQILLKVDIIFAPLIFFCAVSRFLSSFLALFLPTLFEVEVFATTFFGWLLDFALFTKKTTKN